MKRSWANLIVVINVAMAHMNDLARAVYHDLRRKMEQVAHIRTRHQEWMPQAWILRPGNAQASIPRFLGGQRQPKPKCQTNGQKRIGPQESACDYRSVASTDEIRATHSFCLGSNLVTLHRTPPLTPRKSLRCHLHAITRFRRTMELQWIEPRLYGP